MANRLVYKDYQVLSKSEMIALGLKGRQYKSASTGDVIPVSKFQKLAGSAAPSRAPASQRLAHSVPKLTHATEAQKVSETLRNRRSFAEKYGLSLRDASKAKDLKYFNREWKGGLERLKKMESSRKKNAPQSKEEVDLRNHLSEVAKSIGRKKQDDYRDFGQTDSIS